MTALQTWELFTNVEELFVTFAIIVYLRCVTENGEQNERILKH
jgi:hypothetical protein